MARRHPNVAHFSEVEPLTRSRGERFGFTNHRLGDATGGQGLGCSLYVIEPGRTAFPAHYHCANEEAIFVLEGKGTLRLGDDSIEVGPGDYATFRIGPEGAHQLVNTGDVPLRYLCMSTTDPVEVVGYPDSDKVAALAWPPDASAGPGSKPWIAKWFPAAAAVGYYDGEDGEGGKDGEDGA